MKVKKIETLCFRVAKWNSIPDIMESLESLRKSHDFQDFKIIRIREFSGFYTMQVEINGFVLRFIAINPKIAKSNLVFRFDCVTEYGVRK